MTPKNLYIALQLVHKKQHPHRVKFNSMTTRENLETLHLDGYRVLPTEEDGYIYLFLVRFLNGEQDENFTPKMLFEAEDKDDNYPRRDRLAVLIQGYADYLNLGGTTVPYHDTEELKPVYDYFHGAIPTSEPNGLPPAALKLPEGYSLHGVCSGWEFVVLTPDDTYLYVRQDQDVEEYSMEELYTKMQFDLDLEDIDWDPENAGE